MTVASKRNYRKEYDNYHSSEKEKKKRASRNAARRASIKAGKSKKGDGRDVHHKDGNSRNNKKGNLVSRSASSNRSYPRTKRARKVNPRS